jgi:hypothetical protein
MFLHTEGNFLLNSDKKREMYNLPTVSYLRVVRKLFEPKMQEVIGGWKNCVRRSSMIILCTVF